MDGVAIQCDGRKWVDNQRKYVFRRFERDLDREMTFLCKWNSDEFRKSRGERNPEVLLRSKKLCGHRSSLWVEVAEQERAILLSRTFAQNQCTAKGGRLKTRKEKT
jgi:hypothetical protein